MAKILEERVTSIVTLAVLITLACALGACGPRTASLVPSEIQATLAKDASANSPKLTADDILANALGNDKGGETVVAKTSPALTTANNEFDAQTIVAKTSSIDTLTTAGISTHQKTNDDEISGSSLASGWVETGQEELYGSPADPFDGPDESYITSTQNADELFSSYHESTQSDTGYDDYSLALEDTSPEAPYEQDAQTIFEAARSAQKNKTHQDDTDPNELLARARSLLATQGHATQTPAYETKLQFPPSATKLTAGQYSQIGHFIKQHPDKVIVVNAALGSTGTAYEKLATAEQRLTQLSKLAPQFAEATRKIAPQLPPDTIEIKVSNPHDS